MISTFFLDRRVLAGTTSLLLLLVGTVSLMQLPVEQYPQITPPSIRVSTVYPGASAQVVADTVAAPIEQQLNGIEGMMYMSSTSAADGSYGLTITFDVGSDLDKAQTLIQNRLNIADAQLPEEVRRQGLSVSKQSAGVMMVVSLVSDNGAHDGLFLANYAVLRVRDELSRLPGVGDVQVFGSGAYSMRVWLDPDKLRAYALTPQEVVRAIGQQNIQSAAGQVGQQPTSTDQAFQFTVTALGRLSDPEQFRGMIIKTGTAGQVYLRDIARVELGAMHYDTFTHHENLDAAALLIYQLPGSNALETAWRVRKAMDRMAGNFPAGLRHGYPYDSTPFVEEAVAKVYWTLLEAGVLVLVVILLFLQDWRATLIPATTVPVTIIGAFAVMNLLDFSVNLLTLFGLVLAIGIVVDDAIVIVESVTSHIEEGLSPRDATVKAMQEVTWPILGITMVLMAVFIPAAFLQGTTGRIYQQFALTIAATAILSAINALTLKPVQASMWLRASPKRKVWFARAFDSAYRLMERNYTSAVRWLVRRPLPVLFGAAGMIALTVTGYRQLPVGFLPDEDQGYAIVVVQLPDSAALSRTQAAAEEVSAVLSDTPGVDTWMMLGGFSLLDSANVPNTATCFVMFDSFENRNGKPELTQQAILGTLNKKFSAIQDAQVFAFGPPAIVGLGVAGGFELQIEDRESLGTDELQRRTLDVLNASRESPMVANTTSTLRSGVQQILADIDRDKVYQLELTLEDVFGALQIALGSVYVNDFNKFGRTYQVRVQADNEFRNDADDVLTLSVRNRNHRMVPLGSVIKLRHTVGPQVVKRYNTFPSATILGSAQGGVSASEALAHMEQIASASLPPSMGYEWTGLAFEEQRVGNQTVVVFALSIAMVFLVLAPMYESWIVPLSVLFVVPLGLLGVMAAVSFAGIENNVYVQIGAVLIVALGSKNAILIVEFARELRLEGRSTTDAAIEAARRRLRPVLMTSMSFIAGVLPLLYAEGAGAVSRRSLGTAVFGGMISSTILAIFLVPVAYIVTQQLEDKIRRRPASRP